MKKLITVLLLTVFSIVSFSQNLVENVNSQVILKYKQGTPWQLVDAFTEFYNVPVVAQYDQVGMIVVQFSGNYDDFAKDCYNSGLFDIVERDQIQEMKMDYIPNDPEFTSCWHLRSSTDKDIDADEAWDLLPTDNQWVSVAMFDGGLDITMPEFVGNIDSPFNAVTGTNAIPYVNSEDKHGTACSGTIAARTNNGIGVSSVGNNYVRVMPVNIMSQVYSGGSFATTSTIQIAAVNAAMNNPNCVAIAMSYGGSNYSAALDAAFQSARVNGRGGKGMMIFASSGNGYSSTAAQYPANYPAVWGVGATNSSDVRASFSNFGQICDISAPGASIRTTDRLGADGYNTTDYTSISGTSFSCPITAAASAIIAYKNWELTDDEILQILSSTCDKVGGYTYSNDPAWPYSTRSNELGYGRINLKNAVVATPNPGGDPPPPPVIVSNYTVNNLIVTPSTVNLGSTILVDYTAHVVEEINLTSTFATFVKVQYRYSNNSTLGDSDDIIIGVDSVSLGGGVTSATKSFSYTVGGTAGTRYIFVTINYDNVVEESITTDNTTFKAFTVTDPSMVGTDIQLELVQPASNPWTTSLQIVNVQWRATNTGTTTVNQIRTSRGWINCTSGFGCTNTSTWNGTLLPGQSTLLPANNTIVSVNLCHPSFCAVPVGTSNTFRLNLVSVNGVAGDTNPTNNRVDLVFNRISTTQEDIIGNHPLIDDPNMVYVEDEYPISVEIYTVSGALLDINRYDELPSGIYILKATYTNETKIYKWAK
jgi:subtilisin family serine protease